MEIGYSDGAPLESRLIETLRSSEVLSSESRVGEEAYDEWAFEYHLCPERANLLRHLCWDGLDVLEVGAGFGAVSRYVAERCRSLYVVEGTQPRFEGFKQRLRDLKNWDGVVGNFARIEPNRRVDVVLVIGVLEYSALFFEGEPDPYAAFLKRAKSWLKPNGVLVMAIENSVGLKYLTGASEDHTSQLFDGVLGYPTGPTPRTFSKKVLSEIVGGVGFKAQDWFFAFPDYKISQTVIHEDALPKYESYFGKWVARESYDVYGPAKIERFSYPLGLMEAANQGLLSDFANSFLVVASQDGQSTTQSQLLTQNRHYHEVAWNYVWDKKQLVTERFVVESDSKTLWRKTEALRRECWVDHDLVLWEMVRALGKSAEAFDRVGLKFLSEGILKFSVSADHRWVKSDLMSYDFASVWTKHGTGSIQWDCQPMVCKEPFASSAWVLHNVSVLMPHLHPSLSGLRFLGCGRAIYEWFCDGLGIGVQFDDDLKFERVWVESQLGRKMSAWEMVQFEARWEEDLSAKVENFERERMSPTRFGVRTGRDIMASIKESLRRRIFSWIPRPSSLGVRQVALSSKGWTRVKGVSLESVLTLRCFPPMQLGKPCSEFKVSLVPGKPCFIEFPSPVMRFEVIEGGPAVVEMKPVAKSQVIVALAVAMLREKIRHPVQGMEWLKRLIRYYRRGKGHGFRAGLRSELFASTQVQNVYSLWISNLEAGSSISEEQRESLVAKLNDTPKVSILMPTFDSDIKWLRRAIESVQAQWYPYWELCIADDCSPNSEVLEILKEYSRLDSRIHVIQRSSRGHIARASQSALEMASGDWVTFLDHDDELAPYALLAVVAKVNEKPSLKFLFSDEDKIGTDGKRFFPHFKLKFNQTLMWSYNLVTHLAVMRRDLAIAVGGFREGFEGSQDYDLFLRATEGLKPHEIEHIPHVLYHWRTVEGSTASAMATKDYAIEAGQKAVSEHLKRIGVDAVLEQGRGGYHHVRPSVFSNHSVAVMIPNRKDIKSKKGPAKVPIVHYSGPIEWVPYDAWSPKVFENSTQEILVFMDSTLIPTQSDWLEQWVSWTMVSDVGMVGGVVYDSHGDICDGALVWVDQGPQVWCQGISRYDEVHIRRHGVIQEVPAVSLKCFGIRREVAEQVGLASLSFAHERMAATELGARVRSLGKKVLWNPYLEFQTKSVHSSSEIIDEESKHWMLNHWQGSLEQDFYHPAWNRRSSQFELSFHPRNSGPSLGNYR